MTMKAIRVYDGSLACAMLLLAGAAKTASAKGRGGSLDDIFKTASDCVKAGTVCLRHCQEALSKGDLSLKDCQASVQNMLAACEAMASVAGQASAPEASLRAMAAACARFCRDCEAQCQKHAKHHKVCADCMKSCAACAKACEAYA
jgi:Cys-rich four helix bundle protein (predicted Tat secretion target)